MSKVSEHMKRLMSVFETSSTTPQPPDGNYTGSVLREKRETCTAYEQDQTRQGAEGDRAASVRRRPSDVFLQRLAAFEPRSTPEPGLGSAQLRRARVNNQDGPAGELPKGSSQSPVPETGALAGARCERAPYECGSSGTGQPVSSLPQLPSPLPVVQEGLLRPVLASDAAADYDSADAPARSGYSGAGDPEQPSSCEHFSLLRVKILPDDEEVYGRSVYDASLADSSREARHLRFRCCAKLLEEGMNPKLTVRRPAQTRPTEGLSLERERQLSDNLLREGLPADASWFEREESGEARFAICRAILRLRISEDESAAGEPRQPRATLRLGAIPVRTSVGQMSNGLQSAAVIEKTGDDEYFAVPWFDSTLADGSREARRERFRLCADLLDSRLREYLSSIQN